MSVFYFFFILEAILCANILLYSHPISNPLAVYVCFLSLATFDCTYMMVLLFAVVVVKFHF